MGEKAGIILRDLLLDALETYREEKDNVDYEDEFYDLLGKSIKKAKEGFLDSPGIMGPDYYYDDQPESFEYFLAPVYAVEMCSLIPVVSERATKLLSKVTGKNMDGVTEKYMEEASRCYIYGFSLASAIMCRGSIEYSLKKYLGITESKDDIERYSIHYLLNEAIKKRGSFNRGDKRIVLSIHNGASDCVHGRRQINSAKCLEYINNTKMIIEKLLR